MTIKLTAKQEIATKPCKKCGTHIRNIYTRACVECDRIRQRAKYASTRPNYQPRNVKPKQAEKPKKVVIEKQLVADITPAVVQPDKNAFTNKFSSTGLLKQPTTQLERYLTSNRLQADLDKFLAQGGMIKQGGSSCQ